MRAASIRFLLGKQPRLTQVPPSARASVITAVLPSSAARSAAAKAVEPEPKMTRSNCSVIGVLCSLGDWWTAALPIGLFPSAMSIRLGREQLVGASYGDE